MFFDDFKEKLSASRKKKFTLTKRDAAVGVTVGVLCLAGSSIVSYEPGTILFQQQHPNTKTAKIGEYSKSAGPRQVVEPKDYDPNAGIQKPATLPQAQGFPQFNMPIFNKDKLPTGLPSFTTNPTPTKPTQDPFAGLVDNSAVYAKHASITNWKQFRQLQKTEVLADLIPLSSSLEMAVLWKNLNSYLSFAHQA